jgi:hypothetical protein
MLWPPASRFALMTDHLMRQAIEESHILVVPHADFFKFLDPYTIEELNRKQSSPPRLMTIASTI